MAYWLGQVVSISPLQIELNGPSIRITKASSTYLATRYILINLHFGTQGKGGHTEIGMLMGPSFRNP